MNPNLQRLAIWGAALVLLAALFNLFNNNNTPNRRGNEVSYSKFLSDVEAGKVSEVTLALDTVMGCLACSYPATLAWEILQRHAGGAISISEDAAKAALKDLAQGNFGDATIEGGESGIAAFAGFLSLLHSFNQRTTFDINTKSDILVLLTEGPTDPKKFEKIVGRAPILSYS